MKKLATASISTIIFIAGCSISSNDGNILQIRILMYFDEIPPKLNIPRESGMVAQTYILFMDLV